MHRLSHLIFGGALTVVAGALLLPKVGEGTVVVASLASLVGTTAPDTLEVRYWRGNASVTLLPHRTITHYPPLWLALFVAGVWLAWNISAPAGIALTGFSFGAFTHLLADMMTPMGIPIWHPYKHRKSLRIITSRWRNALVIAVACLSAVVASKDAFAAQGLAEEPPNRCVQGTECGWWFGYIDPLAQQEEEPEEEAPTLSAQPPEETKDPCRDKTTWTAKCGFVDPEGDFAFQAIQRDALFEQATMNPRDSKAVEALQYYHKWMLDQATLMTRMWEWNMIQNSDLNPAVSNAVTSFGLRAAALARDERRKTVFQDLQDQGAFLVWFTRPSCSYCGAMASVVQRVGRYAGLPVWDASLEDTCMPGFEDRCKTAPETIEPATLLGVKSVPDLFLHLPKDDVWVRVSSGMDAAQTILGRIDMFFSAIRSAAAKGIASTNGRPPVDFDERGLQAALVSAGVVQDQSE